jgi:acyl carrier protein
MGYKKRERFVQQARLCRIPEAFSGARRAVRVCNTTAKRRPQEWILLKKSVHCWLSSWTLTTLESDIMSDFEADSLDIVDMVMTLEDEFGIEVPDDAIESLRTVGDVVNFVDSHAQN